MATYKPRKPGTNLGGVTKGTTEDRSKAAAKKKRAAGVKGTEILWDAFSPKKGKKK